MVDVETEVLVAITSALSLTETPAPCYILESKHKNAVIETIDENGNIIIEENRTEPKSKDLIHHSVEKRRFRHLPQVQMQEAWVGADQSGESLQSPR